MTTPTIKTNNVPRDLVGLDDVPEKDRADFDYVPPEDAYSARFFCYRGSWYDAHEFQVWSGPEDSPLAKWDAFQADSYFSAVAIRFPVDEWSGERDFERVVVGLFLS